MIASLCLAAILGTAAPATVAPELCWAGVREGATREQVSALLGAPLMRNSSRGHERWVYDAGCEVQFKDGLVRWWTAPRGAATPAPELTRRETPSLRTRT